MIVLTGKMGRLAILIRKLSTLQDDRVKCKYCNEKVKHSQLFKHIRFAHGIDSR